jgi:hypothetical protein
LASKKIGLDQIIGLVLPDNAASIRVLEKAGMQSEGEFVYDGTLLLRYAKPQVPANNCVNVRTGNGLMTSGWEPRLGSS